MLRTFCSPSRTAVLGLNGPAPVVAGRSAVRLLSEVWGRTFADAAIRYQVHEFGGQCSQSEIHRIVDAARSDHARVIVGVGGGKVLDAARAAAVDLNLPVVSCPTVASSDAPCSALSVVYTEAGEVGSIRI